MRSLSLDECAPTLYRGILRHRRFAPKRHGFQYSACMVLLDLDHIQQAMATSPLLGYNRFAWASFDERDHLGDPALPLKSRLKRDAEAQGYEFPDGPVHLLTNLRYLGYCFNPVSYIYAYDKDGMLSLIGAEVTNTPWKERIVYWMKPEGLAKAWSFDVAKAMHVSPFFPMDLRYRWTFTPPKEKLLVRMALHHKACVVFDADLRMDRQAWNSKTICHALLHFPIYSVKVILAIHWEALRLWLKRIPIYNHPRRS